MKNGGRRQSRRSSCLLPPGAPSEEAAQRRVPSRAKRRAGHGDRCDNTRQGSLSEAKSAGTGTKKRSDKPQGQSSRRAAVVCDAPEVMGSEPGFGASEQSEVAR